MQLSCAEIHHEVVQVLSERYNVSLMNNKDRGEYVEALIAHILGSKWELTWRMPRHSSWSEWDIENTTTGEKIEVKQSASWQLWETDAPTTPRFDIRENTGYWSDEKTGLLEWVEFDKPKRLADIYIFAWHCTVSRGDADHREVSQWQFYVVPTGKLPIGQKSIGLQPIKGFTDPVDYKSLAAQVTEVLTNLSNLRNLEQEVRSQRDLPGLKFANLTKRA